MRTSVARLLKLALCTALLGLLGCGTVTKRPDVDPTNVEAEATRMYENIVGRDRELNDRLYNLSTPLLIGNADLCGSKTKFAIKIAMHSLQDYRGKRRDAMESVYDLDDRIRLTLVGREGPAHIAGLRSGDAILAVNDVEVPTGMTASLFYKNHIAPLIDQGKPIKFTIMRKAERITAYVQPVLACDYPVRMVRSGVVNAFADGSSITVYTALMEAFKTDDELGVVLSHELAHNLMGHIDKQMVEHTAYRVLATILNRSTNTNAGSVVGGLAYLQGSVDREYEADYVGLYLAARAGLNYELAPEFLRKLAMDSPAAISHDSTHPQLARRYVAQNEAISEIRKKMTLGQPLLPEFKSEAKEEKKLKDGFVPEKALGQ